MFKSQPKGLIPAALSNMGERFGYYIMNAVLTLFLCSKFGLSDETSGLIYSFFYAGIYVLSLVGGIIADMMGMAAAYRVGALGQLLAIAIFLKLVVPRLRERKDTDLVS